MFSKKNIFFSNNIKIKGTSPIILDFQLWPWEYEKEKDSEI